MSRPLLDQALTFSGTGVAQNDAAYVPASLRGQSIEYTFYVQFNASVSAGKIQIETASADNYSGTWAAVGNTIDWAAASTQKYASVTGVFGALRLRIDTAVANGTMSAWVIAASHAP